MKLVRKPFKYQEDAEDGGLMDFLEGAGDFDLFDLAPKPLRDAVDEKATLAHVANSSVI